MPGEVEAKGTYPELKFGQIKYLVGVTQIGNC